MAAAGALAALPPVQSSAARWQRRTTMVDMGRTDITARPIHMARPASGVGYGLATLGLAPAFEPHLNTGAP